MVVLLTGDVHAREAVTMARLRDVGQGFGNPSDVGQIAGWLVAQTKVGDVGRV